MNVHQRCAGFECLVRRLDLLGGSHRHGGLSFLVGTAPVIATVMMTGGTWLRL